MLRDRGLRKVHSRKRAGVYNSPGSFLLSEFPRIVFAGNRILSEYRGRLLFGFRANRPVQKAKIVHLAHVLTFARLHYIAVEPQPGG